MKKLAKTIQAAIGVTLAAFVIGAVCRVWVWAAVSAWGLVGGWLP